MLGDAESRRERNHHLQTIRAAEAAIRQLPLERVNSATFTMNEGPNVASASAAGIYCQR